MEHIKSIRPQVVNIDVPEVITTAELTDHTQEILHHFGLNAPSLLNTYSCCLEDALIESVQKMKMWRELYEEQSIELSAARDLNALRQQLIKEESDATA